MMRTGFAALLLTVIAGCASSPADVATAPRAKASAVLDPGLLVEGAEKGTIRIVRDRGVFGSARNALIYIDGRHVANVDANRVLELQVPEGVIRLGLQMDNVTEPIQYQQVSVKPNVTYDYRVSMTGNGLTTDWRLDRLN